MINTFNTRLTTLTVAAVTLACAAPVAAQSLDDTVSVSVRYGDLDISKPAGAEVLLRRIDKAAVRVCGGKPDQRLLGEHAAFEKCRAATIDRSVAALNAPMVTAAAGRSSSRVAMVGP
ncbi:MAG TPA: UrcA family protein [Caulobacteraceae bacterium]|nr:UrcA family protein [Caulobacteraceae bacterium]